MPELAGAIGSSIEEGGAVRESASDAVKRARTRLRTLEGRIRGILKV
jgi:dsDNA-specific endonuclease/ATPase MutS2